MTKLYIGDHAVIKGNVTFGSDCSVWHNAVIRGDNASIEIGEETNIQDLVMIHTGEDGNAVKIGSHVTIGHSAIVHGCTVGNDVLIGMGAIIMNDAVIGNQCIIGAGALITQNKVFPAHSMIVGSPAKCIRELTEEEIAGIRLNADRYVKHAKEELNENDL